MCIDHAGIRSMAFPFLAAHAAACDEHQHSRASAVCVSALVRLLKLLQALAFRSNPTVGFRRQFFSRRCAKKHPSGCASPRAYWTSRKRLHVPQQAQSQDGQFKPVLARAAMNIDACTPTLTTLSMVMRGRITHCRRNHGDFVSQGTFWRGETTKKIPPPLRHAAHESKYLHASSKQIHMHVCFDLCRRVVWGSNTIPHAYVRQQLTFAACRACPSFSTGKVECPRCLYQRRHQMEACPTSVRSPRKREHTGQGSPKQTRGQIISADGASFCHRRSRKDHATNRFLEVRVLGQCGAVRGDPREGPHRAMRAHILHRHR